jgi:UDP-glucose 4-epimerase
VLGFAPRHTSIESMVAHAWAWRQKAPALYGRPH